MDIRKIVITTGGCILIAFLGSLITTPSIPTWYETLNKPPFNPPNWIFGPVWTILYLLMGVSAYLVWEKGLENKNVKFALLLFITQLILNLLWSVFFFGLHLPFIAFIDILFLWTVIIFTILKFKPLSTLAAQLLYPYILWVSFALLLNLSIFLLN